MDCITKLAVFTIVALLTTTVQSSSVDDGSSSEESCKGKVFSGICDVMLAMKKDIDESTRQTNIQFQQVRLFGF